MVRTKYTPEPWFWLNGSLIEARGRRNIVLTGGMGGQMLTRGADGLLMLLDPDDPRARLIAAAPQMLAALRDIVGDLGAPLALAIPVGGETREEFVRLAMHSASAAISVATGEGER